MGLKRSLLALAIVAVGCGGTSETLVSPDEVTATERAATRSRVVADGVEVRATMWTPGLVQVAASTVPGPAKAKVDARRRWMERYVAGPAFTVVVDIARRRPDPPRADVKISDPKYWSFALGESSTPPDRVDLVAIDRFPTEGGGHHERLVFELHFPQKSSPTAPEVALHIRCDAPEAWRKALGRTIARRGVRLRWALTRVQTTSRTGDHLGV